MGREARPCSVRVDWEMEIGEVLRWVSGDGSLDGGCVCVCANSCGDEDRVERGEREDVPSQSESVPNVMLSKVMLSDEESMFAGWPL